MPVSLRGPGERVTGPSDTEPTVSLCIRSNRVGQVKPWVVGAHRERFNGTLTVLPGYPAAALSLMGSWVNGLAVSLQSWIMPVRIRHYPPMAL